MGGDESQSLEFRQYMVHVKMGLINGKKSHLFVICICH